MFSILKTLFTPARLIVAAAEHVKHLPSVINFLRLTAVFLSNKQWIEQMCLWQRRITIIILDTEKKTHPLSFRDIAPNEFGRWCETICILSSNILSRMKMHTFFQETLLSQTERLLNIVILNFVLCSCIAETILHYCRWSGFCVERNPKTF